MDLHSSNNLTNLLHHTINSTTTLTTIVFNKTNMQTTSSDQPLPWLTLSLQVGIGYPPVRPFTPTSLHLVPHFPLHRPKSPNRWSFHTRLVKLSKTGEIWSNMTEKMMTMTNDRITQMKICSISFQFIFQLQHSSPTPFLTFPPTPRPI